MKNLLPLSDMYWREGEMTYEVLMVSGKQLLCAEEE